MGLYRHFVFPRLLDFVMSRPHMMEQRQKVLAPAAGEVLEIGFGTGLNLSCYPSSVTKLTILDKTEFLPSRVQTRIAASTIPISKATLDAAELPFDAGRFDVVVSTWTLCSIDQIDRALVEIRRVLKPDGRLLFLEHGRSEDPKVARRQDRWNPVQRWIGDGCNMNRPIDQLIASSGLRVSRLERFEMPKSPRVLAAHYLGEATPE